MRRSYRAGRKLGKKRFGKGHPTAISDAIRGVFDKIASAHAQMDGASAKLKLR
jgi:hypothetical protein